MKKILNVIMIVILVNSMIAVTGLVKVSRADESDSKMPEVRTITLPILENRDHAVTIADGYIYYLGEKEVIYQAPLDDPTKTKTVYQFSADNEEGFAAQLTTINKTAILTYHVGSASMGTDYAVALYSDGSYQDLIGSYSNSIQTEEATIVLATNLRAMGLEIRHNSENDFTPLGESNCSYGSYFITDGQMTSHCISSDLAVVGNEVYVIAKQWREAENVVDPVGIYAVNIKTNATKRVFTQTATHFKVNNGNIYFTDLDGFLYRAQIGSNQATKVSDMKMKEFFIVGDEIYYTPYQGINGGEEQDLFKLGSSESLAPGSVLEYAPIDANESEGYLSCRLYNLTTSSYNGIVIGKSGESVLLNSDEIQYLTVYGDVIYEVVRSQAQNEIKLIIDGQQVTFSQTDGLGVPCIENDRTMVPLRKSLEAIGASVNYETSSRTVTIIKDNVEISIVIDGGMLVNGSEYPVDAPAMIKNGRVYVPIRHVFEALGYSLSWDSETKTVNIIKTGSPIETVKGWSVPSFEVGSVGLGMTDYIGVLTEFPSYSKYDNVVSLKNQEQIDELNTVGIGLRNSSDNKQLWLNSITFEYQVYMKTNGKEELVYRKGFLPFEGTLPAQSGNGTEMEVSFWNSETTTPGEYTIKLAYPEFFTGINKENNEEVKIPIKDNIFGESVVIKVN